MDDIENISKFTMLQIAENFALNGGKLLCFDEIHKYETWSAELKNIYDNFPKLKIIASGSSALKIHQGSHDLSRRGIIYEMVGMSFREFLGLHFGFEFDSFECESLLQNHIQIAQSIIKEIEKQDITILSLFKKYLKYGYYPYFLSLPNETLFLKTLSQNIHTTIEGDLLSVYPKLSGVSVRKLKLLLSVMMKNVPFTPNMSELKKLIEISDDRTIKEYLSKLDDAGLIRLLMPNALAMKNVDKPEKIYLENTNLMYLQSPNVGNLRETFFVNQLYNYYKILGRYGIFASKRGDFLIDEKYIFEIGGKNKDFSQIKDVKHSYLAVDELEIGFGNKIPLWLFGFLY